MPLYLFCIISAVSQDFYAIFIHETTTLSYICVDPCVVLGGLGVRPLLSSLWMERSLSIFSESQSLCVQIKPVA